MASRHEMSAKTPSVVAGAGRATAGKLTRCCWLGPRSRALGWLHAKTDALVTLSPVAYDGTADAIPLRLLDDICHSPVQRVVLACENRWDYPLKQLEYLSTTWPEVPVALAVSNWWEGAGRTGVGLASCPLLPWYRWWDGWVPWLQGSASHWFGPATNAPYFDLSSLPIESFEREAAGGLILCDHGELATGWRLAVEPRRTHWQTLANWMVNESWEDQHPSIGWCLIDDSVLHTVAHRRADAQWAAVIGRVREMWPASCIICAMNQPDWSLWKGAMAAGANELLGKPALDVGLRRCLLNAVSQP